MNQADNPNQGQGQGAAPGQEHFIPKHRFDEIQSKLREAQEREAMKDRLYMEQLQATRQRQPEPEFNLKPEDTGLDPQTHQAVMKISQTLVGHALQKERQQFQGIIGQMGNELEQAKFLAGHGSDKKRYLPLIQEYQQNHQRATGSFMDAETAYKLVRFDELEAKSKRDQDYTPPAAHGNPTPPAQNQSAPNAANTRIQNTPQSAPAQGFAELDLDAMEARLQEAFPSDGI